MISVTIPIYNEEESIPELYSKLKSSLEKIKRPYEIIFVNDGSSDNYIDVLDKLSESDPLVKSIHFKRNFGQTAAMMAGVDFAQGDIIIPMDGDLQNDPDDISLLLTKIDEGFDVVSGWRKDRQDAPIKRNFLSRVANVIISRTSGVHLHDYGCSLKAYKKDVIKDVKLYGEMHRFIPIYARWQGAKVTEVAVTHHARKYGVSKYGMNRVLKVILDLAVVEFLHKYATKPIYIFGGFGLISFLFSGLLFCWMMFLKLSGMASFIQTPLPLMVVFTALTGFLSILMGFLAELSVRTYHESQQKPIYMIKRKENC